MSHSESSYYPPQSSGPGWEQPCYSGPPQHQVSQFNPKTQNSTYPNQNLGPTSFSPQNKGPQLFHQNQGPAYPQNSSFTQQNQDNFCPTQHQRPSRPPQNHKCNQFTPHYKLPQFTRSDGPVCHYQNQESHFPTESQGPYIIRTKDNSVLLPQNQDLYYPSQNQSPRFPSENQCPIFPAQNQELPFPAQNQGPQFPVRSPNPCSSENQLPFLPPQNKGLQNHSYSHGPHFTPLNQGPPFPVQSEGPNQSPQCPPLNPGTSYQNQAPLGPPQNQRASFPVPNPGSSIPPQNQLPPLPPQTKRPLCPPQGHPSFFSPERPGFPPLHQGPQIPPNEGPLHGPQNQDSGYDRSREAVQQSYQCCDGQYEGDDWNDEQEEQAGNWREQHEKYGDDWSNQENDCKDFDNENDKCAEDWSIQQTNNKSNFKQCVPSMTFKRQRVSPNKNGFESTNNMSNSIERCSNNIKINIVKPSHLKPNVKLENKQFDHLLNKSEQSGPFQQKIPLQGDKERKTQESTTKSVPSVTTMKFNENSSKMRNEQSQMKCQVKDETLRNKLLEQGIKEKPMDLSSNKTKQKCPFFKQTTLESFNQINEEVQIKKIVQVKEEVISSQPNQRTLLDSNECSTENKKQMSRNTNIAPSKDIPSNLRNTTEHSSYKYPLNDSSHSKFIKEEFTEDLVLDNKTDLCSRSSKHKFNVTLDLKNMQNKVKPIQDSNKHLGEERENMLQSFKQETVEKTEEESDLKISQVILNNQTEIDQKIKENDGVCSNLKEAHPSKTDNSLLQINKQSCSNSNESKAEENPKHTKYNTILNLGEQCSFNTSIMKSQKENNLHRQKLKSCKRLNSQTGDTSNNSKKFKSCVKSVEININESLTKVMVEDGIIKPKSEIEKHVEDVQIKTENNIGENLELDKRFIDTTCSLDNITINKTVDSHCESHEMLGPANETMVKEEEYFGKTANIKTETDNTIGNLSNHKTTVTNKIVPSKEKLYPVDTTNIAHNGRAAGIMDNVPSYEALVNKLMDLCQNNSEARVQNHTNSSEMASTTSEWTCQEYLIHDDKSLNSELKRNYQSTNDDSQYSSCLPRNVNILEDNLREFDILDEVEGSENEEDEDHSTSTSEESDLEYSDQEAPEVDEEAIDAMLEEGLATNKGSTENKAPKKVRHKVILEEIGHNHFDLLPEGWIQVMHKSGMPVYLNQKSRVCCMARPYFLGPGSVRNHKIPLSAIPCLQYKRAKEIEKKYEEENKAKQAEVSVNNDDNLPPLLPVISAKIETAEENEAAQSLEPSELQEYCKSVFSFKTISIIPFKTWGDRRKYGRMTKDLKKQQRPLLPSGTKLLKFPIQNPDGTIAKSKGEWVINPNGKSYVCILHEYVQHALKQHPKYQFKELKNPSTPYSATVYIGEMQYGTGIGTSKKHAKLEAAKAALEVLIPEMKDKMENENEFGINSGISKKPNKYENSIFDQIRIEDPRVAEFCAKSTEPPPYAILATCLQRNGMGLKDVKVEYNMNTKRHKEDEYKMVVKNHTATVMCKNKREGKQKAAQAILKALHPNIEYFGSLLRMYGNHSMKGVKEKKQEEQEITGLQCKAAVNQPNYDILNKLQTEMRKSVAKKKELLGKGKFICYNNLLPSASSADLKKIRL